MKKAILISCLLLCGVTALADDYFTMGVNDTILIYPNTLSENHEIPVSANFSGRLNEWNVVFSYPNGMEPRLVERGDGMSIPYIDCDSNEQILIAPLTVAWNNTSVSSQIWTYGYWDYNHDGIVEPYGYVKWEEGYYACMFLTTFHFQTGFSGGTITISGSLNTTPDERLGTIEPPVYINRSVEVVVGYMRGDVNGDGSLTIDDVTALINYLLNPDGAGWNQYQIAAADVDGNGSIGINDVTALTNLLIHSGTNNIEELLDILSAFNQMMYSRGHGVYSEPAGIDELTGMTRHAIDDNYYNLMGQPVGKELPSTPGIYIHQGKKIVVR